MQRKFKIIAIPLLLISAIYCAGNPGKPNCHNFRTGKFTYKEEPFNSVIITRTKRKQVEYDTRTGFKIKLKIRWTGDCEYELIQKWSNSKVAKRNKGLVITVQMINI